MPYLNTFAVDGWSFFHFLAGAMWVFLWPRLKPKWRFTGFLVFAIGWEVIEFLQGPSGVGGAETTINSVVDVGFNLLGYWFGRWAISER